jgi:RNA polymerase sigma factor (sigma-70 family)
MTCSLPQPTGSSPAPNSEKDPAARGRERDQAWNDALTYDQYQHYYGFAWNVAYLTVGNAYEADVVTDKVMDELQRREQPPSQEEIYRHLRTLSRSRALDQVRSARHRLRMLWRPFIRPLQLEDAEVLPRTPSCAGAEDTFFQQEESERFAQQLALALGSLNDLQRVCFVLRFIDGMKPEDIALLLHVPASKVHTLAYRARNRVATLLERQGIQPWKTQRQTGEGGVLPSEHTTHG